MNENARRELQLLLLKNGAILRPGVTIADLNIPDHVPDDWTNDEG